MNRTLRENAGALSYTDASSRYGWDDGHPTTTELPSNTPLCENEILGVGGGGAAARLFSRDSSARCGPDQSSGGYRGAGRRDGGGGGRARDHRASGRYRRGSGRARGSW
jgi:hypothetical protein